MKVLYVASNPENASSLMIEKELTLLQRRFSAASGEPVDFVVLPALPFEEFALEIANQQPDILHLSAHGDGERLTLAGENHTVAITGDLLRKLLFIERPPKIVYLNACDSTAIARELVGVVPIAIGTTAPITNRTACAAAVLFYDRLLRGASVQQAFEASCAMMQASQKNGLESEIHCGAGVDPARMRLHHLPRIVAGFVDDKFTPDRDDDHYEFMTGILGCPANTYQGVIFTDDETFLPVDDEFDELADYKDDFPESWHAYHLSRIKRSRPQRNLLWFEESIRTTGDHRLFAAGVTASGETFAISASLCDAIEDYFRYIHPGGVMPAKARVALEALRTGDGYVPEPSARNAGRKNVRRK